MLKRPLAIGVDDFEKIITKEYYYVDKTLLIKELLDKKGEVNLFTRPRRFGKTLNLSMLRYYFENTGDEEKNHKNADLFSGLAITDAGEKYTKEMGQYPVIMLTLKSAKQPSWELAYLMLKRQIAEEFFRHKDIIDRLPETEERYRRIMSEKAEMGSVVDSLAFLSKCLYQAYGQKCIILIDEYDVPLENAYFTGFYDEMVGFIRSLFESALKTNPYLEFAVITGCLRISRESIFTGLNNLRIYSILSENYDEYFGFTEGEVLTMLKSYDREGNIDTVKEWYDGYCFGDVEVYNPWSVINYMQDIITNPDSIPTPYWANTSSNSIVREMVENSSEEVREELEELINGGTIEKPVHEDITYDSIHDTEDNLWNFLFFTGYLKKISSRLEEPNQIVTMAIPNTEVIYIYENTIRNWFDKKKRGLNISPLYAAIENGDTEQIAEEVSGFLMETISFFDYGESYYHGFLAGLLRNNGKYRVISNREAGLGRADIILKTPRIRNGKAIIMELKTVKSYHDMEKGCEAAIKQIEEQKYREELEQEGYQDILCYGICFFRKECLVSRL